MARRWQPKHKVFCERCNWTGKRTRSTMHYRCPRCRHYPVKRTDPSTLNTFRRTQVAKKKERPAVSLFEAANIVSQAMPGIVNLSQMVKLFVQLLDRPNITIEQLRAASEPLRDAFDSYELLAYPEKE